MGVVPLLLKVLSRGASGGCHDGLVVWDKYPHSAFAALYLSPVDRVPSPPAWCATPISFEPWASERVLAEHLALAVLQDPPHLIVQFVFPTNILRC